MELPDLPDFSDEQMQAALESTKTYTLVLLSAGPAYGTEGSRAVIWEHGRRNFSLRAAGLLSIVGPMADDGPLRGVQLFDLEAEQTILLMEQDPAVVAGILTYELHPMHSFPGDALRP